MKVLRKRTSRPRTNPIWYKRRLHDYLRPTPPFAFVVSLALILKWLHDFLHEATTLFIWYWLGSRLSRAMTIILFVWALWLSSSRCLHSIFAGLGLSVTTTFIWIGRAPRLQKPRKQKDCRFIVTVEITVVLAVLLIRIFSPVADCI